MIPNKIHIIFLLFLGFTSIQNSYGNIQQTPKHIRTFDQNFKEQYSDKKYNYEGKEIVSTANSGSGKYEDYKKNENPHLKESNDREHFTINLGPFSWLFYLVIIIAVLYLVYILLNEGGTGLFSSKQSKKLDNHEEITADNIQNVDINALILDAESNNDYRLAIRYYYLLVLKTLSIKNHIKFEEDKTNAEYLNEINSKPFCTTFSYVSYLYNYIWYGKFPLNIEQYTKAKGDFVTLLNQVE
ncbi:ATP-grasp domain-containing protein [Yeosuana marina]|uniref:hypothetical protein n=1 Tax=Yeosuana marina TaxID=1565536 RepID=UPI001421D07A|nr:hypothetical protein [Yeosuana marina]